MRWRSRRSVRATAFSSPLTCSLDNGFHSPLPLRLHCCIDRHNSLWHAFLDFLVVSPLLRVFQYSSSSSLVFPVPTLFVPPSSFPDTYLSLFLASPKIPSVTHLSPDIYPNTPLSSSQPSRLPHYADRTDPAYRTEHHRRLEARQDTRTGSIR